MPRVKAVGKAAHGRGEMEKFKNSTEGLICPWCPPDKGEPVCIHKCGHNPFVLMKKNKELMQELSKLERTDRFLSDLKDLLRE